MVSAARELIGRLHRELCKLSRRLTEAFRSHRVVSPMAINELNCPAIIEGTQKVRNGAPNLVKGSGF